MSVLLSSPFYCACEAIYIGIGDKLSLHTGKAYVNNKERGSQTKFQVMVIKSKQHIFISFTLILKITIKD